MAGTHRFRVSICIPTYNRAACLRELLESIEQQQRDDLEVVVADDASTDQTAAVLAEFQPRIPHLRCLVHAQNRGLDQNYQAVAAAASGEFLWMMGDDDRVEPGGVDILLRHLDQWPGIVGMTVGVLDYDSSLQQVTGLRDMPAAQTTRGVCALFTLIPEHLGFMSALVIRRDCWMQVVQHEPVHHFQNLYSQVYIIGKAVGDGGLWGVTPAVCVAFRSDNDQFKSKLGWYGRLEADVLAYSAIGGDLLAADAAARYAMAERILDCHVMARLLSGSLAGLTSLDVMKSTVLLFQNYRHHRRCWTKALPTLYAPALTLRAARWCYHRFNPYSGRARARAMGLGVKHNP